jgi:dTDP-glucose 4,6-dehydratase
MPEKFLILGASSFYGSNFARLVEERGGEAIRFRHYYETLEPCDYIVNFASKSLVAESWEFPAEWVDVNVSSLSIVIEELRRFGKFKKFIHVSTPEVYGSTKEWVKEGHAFNPSTPYAVSRAAGDMMLMAYFRAYGFPALITRTANIYGEGQQDFRIIPKAFSYKREGKVLPLHGDGESIRSFIHVRDACEATYLLAKEGKVGETYHISPNDAYSIRGVVQMIGCDWESAPERIGKDHAYLLNSDRIREMGWTDEMKLEDWIARNRP